MAGQTINDRLLAARHSLAGQGLAKSVCKATTEEMIGPKKKHLDCKFHQSIFLSDSNHRSTVFCLCNSCTLDVIFSLEINILSSLRTT